MPRADAARGGAGFACGRTQAENVAAVLDDVMAHGNAAAGALLPGALEARAAAASAAAGGLLLSAAELQEMEAIARAAGAPCDACPAPRA